MKKILFALTIMALLILPTQTKRVYAARLYQGASPNVTVTGTSTEIINEDYAWQEVATANNIDGSGTPLVIATTSATMKCRGVYPDPPGTTSVCPYVQSWVDVVNDTGDVATLTACADIYDDPFTGAPPSYGRFIASGHDTSSDLPHRICATIVVPNTETVRLTLRSAAYDAAGTGVWTEAAYKINLDLYLAWGPVNTCADQFTEVSSDTLEIDPVIEDPLGPAGSPADDQIFTTVTGQYYSVTTSGGPWNDGTVSTREDAAISWDGLTWVALVNADAVCIQSTPGGGTTYYLLATSTTFYIRVNDLPGEFADNTATTPYLYTIATLLEYSPPCESQYIYDEYTDSVGFIGVPGSNSLGVTANNAEILLIPGDWYVVHWNIDYWQDDGGPNQTRLEYSWFGSGSGYAILGEGSESVWCATADGVNVLIQADGPYLFLRVNNLIGDFTDNTGTPYYDIYHATFIRTPESCELAYQVDDLIESKTVSADQSGGQHFAVVTTNTLGTTFGNVDYGGWYALDTQDGPWQESSISSATNRYDMAVSQDDGATWEPLETWSYSVCNFAVDALGHRRVIFQMPFQDASSTNRWKLRVNDETLWFDNRSSMSWNLYGVTKLSSEPLPGNGLCDYSWDTGSPIAVGSVDGDDADGVPLTGLSAGEIYVLKIIGAIDGWREVALGDLSWDMELSRNAGANYYDLPTVYPSPVAQLCSHVTGDDLFVFLRPGANFNYQLRVNSVSFDNNTGSVQYVVYPATAGQTIVNSCFEGWSLQVLNNFQRVGSLALGPRDELGSVLAADTARYTEYQALTVGNSYAVEIPVNSERWTDGTTTTARSDAAITNDNGVTWEEITMDNTMIDCASEEIVGNVWRVKFTMEEGQVWKIRVNDSAGAFEDNGGSLAYKFYGLCVGMSCTASIPNDSTTNGIPAITVQGGGNVCSMAVMRPAPLAASELLSVGNYIGAWVQYINLSVLRYMAWCPVHTNLLMAFLDKFKTVEPLATVYEWMENFERIGMEIASYDWGDRGGGDFSLFNVRSSSELNTLINDNVFPSGNNSVWDRGRLISFGQGTSLPDAYYSCSSALTERIPASLKMGVCFVSAYFVETSASFWIQIALDIGAFFMMIGFLKSSIQEIIYMLTGVKPWTKSGANASIEKLTDYFEKENRNAEIERASRINGLTNKYWDYRKK